MTDPTAASYLQVPVMRASANGSSRLAPLEEEVTNLFDQLRSPLLRYVLSFGLPVPDGEEVIQEVFLALFQHLRHGRPRENLRGWVFRVAHNLAMKKHHAIHQDVPAYPDESLLKQHMDRDPNPEEALAARQRQQHLQAVVRALPEQDRCCIHLRAEGLRYREIAAILGMSLGAVSLSLVRSLARLSRADAGS
jgi:RNA polymerase sigma-70 factor (ECF subfamily)